MRIGSIASLGCVAGLLLVSAALAGEPQKIDPYTGDPVIPEQQTQQSGQIETREVGRYPEPPAQQTTVTTTTTQPSTDSDGRAVHNPKTASEGGHMIGKDASYAAKKVGSTTKEVTTTIGHTARDTTKAIGHGTRDFFHGIGNGLRDGWNDVKD